MRIIEPGHIYQLEFLDVNPRVAFEELNYDRLVFVNRTCDNPEHECGVPHPGTQSQEVLRALIDRSKHVDECLHWDGNALVIYHLRMALTLLESRAMLRKVEKREISPEEFRVAKDGHWIVEK